MPTLLSMTRLPARRSLVVRSLCIMKRLLFARYPNLLVRWTASVLRFAALWECLPRIKPFSWRMRVLLLIITTWILPENSIPRWARNIWSEGSTQIVLGIIGHWIDQLFPVVQVITTRSYDDRLRTIANVREAGLSVCSGGILGLGEVSLRSSSWSCGQFFWSSSISDEY